MDVGTGQCVQVAPFWRSQTLARNSLNLAFLDGLGAAEVQETRPGLCDAPALETQGGSNGRSPTGTVQPSWLVIDRDTGPSIYVCPHVGIDASLHVCGGLTSLCFVWCVHAHVYMRS